MKWKDLNIFKNSNEQPIDLEEEQPIVIPVELDPRVEEILSPLMKYVMDIDTQIKSMGKNKVKQEYMMSVLGKLIPVEVFVRIYIKSGIHSSFKHDMWKECIKNYMED